MDPNNRGYPYDDPDRPSRQQAVRDRQSFGARFAEPFSLLYCIASRSSSYTYIFSAPQMNVQMAQQALDMEEALYLQRQQELDRDIHVQRFLLQEQLQQEALSNAALSNAAASLHASRLYFGGGLGGSGLAAQLQEQEFLLQNQEQLRRQQLQQQILAQTQQNGQAAEKIFADSVIANAIRRSSTGRKRSFDQSEAETVPSNKGVASKSGTAETTSKPKKVRKKHTPSAKKQAANALANKGTKNERDETVAVEALCTLTAFGDELLIETVPFTLP